MNRLASALLLAAAGTFGSLASAATVIPAGTPGTIPARSPSQPPRDGDYTVETLGESTIGAHCATGGFVWVTTDAADAKKPAHAVAAARPSGKPLPKGITPARDAAVRDACENVDLSR